MGRERVSVPGRNLGRFCRGIRPTLFLEPRQNQYSKGQRRFNQSVSCPTHGPCCGSGAGPGLGGEGVMFISFSGLNEQRETFFPDSWIQRSSGWSQSPVHTVQQLELDACAHVSGDSDRGGGNICSVNRRGQALPAPSLFSLSSCGWNVRPGH